MAQSRYLNRALLNHYFGKATFTAPTHIYVGLSSTIPDLDGNNVTEPSGGSYARVTTSPSDWNSATVSGPAYITNANQLNFPQASNNWDAGASIVAITLWDASSGGNFLGFGIADFANPVTNNKVASILAGALLVQLGL